MSQRDRERRGNRRENRHERRQQQHQSGGGDWDCLRIPEGIEVFKPEADKTYHIDVLPYLVGKHNKNADPGDDYFELSYPCYNSLGMEDKRFIAIGNLLGVRDPVKEHFAALKKARNDWEEMKEFTSKWRQMMLVFVHEMKDKGLMLFEGSYGTFGELLDEELRNASDNWVDNFDDPDGGATLEVRFKAQNIGKKKPWIRASKINFYQRKDGFDADGSPKLAAEILKKAYSTCLDDLLKIPTYDMLKAALDGVPDAHEEVQEPEHEEQTQQKDEPPVTEARSQRNAPVTPPQALKRETAASRGIVMGTAVEHPDFGVCTVIRVGRDGYTVVIIDADDVPHKEVDVDDLEVIDDTPDLPELPEQPETPEPPKEETAPPEKPVKKEGARSAAKTAGKKTAAPPVEPTSPSDAETSPWDDGWK
jgi:hypothetical protein